MVKKFLLLLVVISGLCACGTDLTDIEDRLKKVENQGKDLENQHNKLEEENKKLQEESTTLAEEVRKRQEEKEKIRKRLGELEDSLNTVVPKLLSMEFVAADNPLHLIENVKCEIIGDSAVECRILNVTNSKVLIPRFTFQGSVVTINGDEAESGVTAFDFSKPVVLSVITAKAIKDYTVYVGAYTGLPTVWLETSNHSDVAAANQYYGGKIKVVGNTSTSMKGILNESTVKFMAVGPIAWYQSRIHTSLQLGKNEFDLVFSTGHSLLDSPVGKTWSLYTNKGDKTMLRNRTAFDLSEMSALEYTPRFNHVNFMLNGRYYGTYLLGEDLEVSEGRVNVGDDGFLMGVGTDVAGVSFNTGYLENPVSILAPKASQSEASQAYLSRFVASAERALFASDFANAASGWQKYMDMDSFVDYYLINEIAKNANGAFKKNCMMSLARGGKLKMGPVWDFESAFNTSSSYNGFVVKNSTWYARLFKDPAFVAKVKERFGYFYSHKNDIINRISANAEYLKYAIQEDNNKWNTFTTTANSGDRAWALYQTTVLEMEKWLNARMDWLKGEFDAMV